MRRTTLGPISSSQLNAQSSHPSRLPLVKPTQANASRQSLSSVAQRRASVLNRSSVIRGSISARMSVNGTNRSSQNGSGRRNSTFNGRGGRMNDPRPTSDRNFMTMSIRQLIEFLTDRHYDHPLNPQLLFRPMKKDISNIMQFLFRQLDPNFEFSPKIEEDVADCFRILKYPFPINKSTLSTLGSPHTWSTLLAAISWMIELLSYDTIVQEEGSNERDEENPEKEMFNYLSNSYREFLSGNDEHYDSMTQRMEDRLDAQNQQIQQDTEVVKRENEDLRKQIEALQNAETLQSLNEKKRDYISDRDKLKALFESMEESTTRCSNSIQKLEKKIDQKKQEYNELQDTIAQLQHRIDTQELSAEDLERMQRERTRLQNLLQSVESRYKGIQASHWQIETEISQQMDNLEEGVKEYMVRCRRIKLDEKHAHGVDYAIQIDAHSGGAQAAHALMNHLKKTIIPSLYQFRRTRVERLDRVLDKAVEAKVMVSQVTADMNEAVEAARLIDAQERKAEESIRKEKESMDAALERKSKEIEEKELDLERLQSHDDSSTGYGKAKKLLRDATQAHAEMKEQYEQEIESRLRFIQHAMGMCIALKEHASKQIADAERCVRQFEFNSK